MPAFIGAEGYGKDSIGGRGGTVMEITTLADSGTGSLRAAVDTAGPRIIVFRVGGRIELQSRLTVQHPFITIAGQTAPGDGIMISGHEFAVGGSDIAFTNDVIIRYIRSRPGTGPAERSAFAVGRDSSDVIIDHCSLGWVPDDNHLVFASIPRITTQWCIISEGFQRGLTKGSLWGNGIQSGSLHHSFIHTYATRSPKVDHGNIQVVNNVIYNWQFGCTNLAPSRLGIGKDGLAPLELHCDVVSNYYKWGPLSDNALGQGFGVLPITLEGQFSSGAGQERPAVPDSTAFISDNFHFDSDAIITEANGLLNFRLPGKFPEVFSAHAGFPVITTQGHEEAKDLVVAGVGCTRGADGAIRDSIDTRVLSEFTNRTGTSLGINSESEVGGYPNYINGTPPTDTNNNGLPDEFEATHGVSDPSGLVISMRRALGEPYTDIEWYHMELAGDVTLSETQVSAARFVEILLG